MKEILGIQMNQVIVQTQQKKMRIHQILMKKAVEHQLKVTIPQAHLEHKKKLVLALKKLILMKIAQPRPLVKVLQKKNRLLNLMRMRMRMKMKMRMRAQIKNRIVLNLQKEIQVLTPQMRMKVLEHLLKNHPQVIVLQMKNKALPKEIALKVMSKQLIQMMMMTLV